MSGAFVSKSRRVRFDLTLRIVDLNNVPLVSGTSFIKWHLPASTAAEHRGRSAKCAIKDHRVQYEYEKRTQVRLTVGKDGMLQECPIHFEVVQEYSAGGRGERIVLGQIHLNLAEYVDAGEAQSPGAADREDGITRRYLMQDSKINSTLKIGISMRHIEGTRDYFAPQLRTAPVFGGIAGIIAGSEPTGNPHNPASHTNGDADGQDAAALPNFSTTNKELGEMQDMYRRTLAAYWASQPGELRADECIEDIFGGGDGWGKGGRPASHEQSQPGSGSSTPNEPEMSRDSSTTKISSDGRRNFKGHHDRKGRQRKNAGELEELDVRDDLVSWQVGERADDAADKLSS
ncbi:hypothetical protein DOTSEDRAFT_40956 [Dothistroma septosporum NZE10]|uniref:C2 NT-type domain-containing protein n=1 Tax=Dothistroma septosporum (strain NZE10 / CBS 128990) TaxID=675120 RepID=N1Q219_DOTSN|nr:hypothetical protein DOTSEDRAFT_40956 [Dothistroma septosporum NZE10]